MPRQTIDEAKRQQWLDEIATRPEIYEDQLLGLFTDDLINRIDELQHEKAAKGIDELLGFTALSGASTDEGRLFEYAGNNIALYDDSVEELIDVDPIVITLDSDENRAKYRDDERFARAMRLRRTVVAYILVSVEQEQQVESELEGEAGQQPA